MKIMVTAHAGSRKPRVVKAADGTIHVYVAPKAQEGKANAAIVEALAEFFNVSKSSVALQLGQRSKQKLFEIRGIV